MFSRRAVAVSASSLLALALASGCASPAAPAAPTNAVGSSAKLAKPAPAETVPGELIVRFDPKSKSSNIATAHAAVVGSTIRKFRMPGLEHVRVPVGTETAALVAYRANPAVRYAGPNYVVHTTALPNDPVFGDLWGLDNSGQLGGTPGADINAPEAWDLAVGSTQAAVVFVIDTGMDYLHPDLNDNMWRNPGEFGGTPGVDDDLNGYIDDIHGIDVLDNDGDPFDNIESHATHVAGTIGAEGNNALGVVGVNWKAQIGNCRFIGVGGSLAGAIQCLEYIKALKDAYVLNPLTGANVVVTNNSWGASFFSPALDDAIGAQADSDILFVAAAGNDAVNLDEFDFNPASSFKPNVITVSATDRFDGLAYFSNFSTYSSHVGAPGLDILSTFPTNQGSYATISGTSMAAPHVAGLAALLYANDPTLDFVQLKNLIISSGQQTPGTTGTTITGSRIRAFDTLNGGALNCTGQTARKQVRPAASVAVGAAGSTVDVHAIDVVCAAANGATVTVDVNGTGTFVLNDNGVAPDDWAGDGRYAAAFAVQPGSSVLTFPWGEVLTIVQTEAYDPIQPIAYSPRSITGIPLGMTDDEVVTVTPSFPVMFGNAGFGSLNISNNGFVSFTDSPFLFLNEPLPTNELSTVIAAYWDDFQAFNGGGDVFVEEQGTSPDRELIVEWRSEGHFDLGTQPNAVTVQLVLFESSSDFLVNFVDTTFGLFGYDDGGTATVGVQWGSGAAQQWSFDSPGSVASGTTLLFPLVAPSVNPAVVAAPTYTGTPAFEGDLIDASTSFTDPDGDGPWLVEWDSFFTGVFTVDASVLVTTTGALTTAVPLRQSNDQFAFFYPDPVLAVRITDVDGDRSAPRTVVLTQVSDVASVAATPTLELGVAIEGNFFRFVNTFADPGQDALWLDLWDFDDDFFADGNFTFRSQTGAIASDYFLWTEQGSSVVNMQVVDRCLTDCFSDFIFENLSEVASAPYTILDAQPIVDLGYGYESPTTDEPATVTLFANAQSGALDDPNADPLLGVFQWDLDGDGTFDASTFEPFITHAYDDDGSYSPMVRVYDEDSFTDAPVAIPVLVTNVPPSALAIANQSAIEGYAMVVQAAATDPGNDVITWSLSSGPGGLSVTGSGVVVWAPSYFQADLDGVTYTVTIEANDGDGGTDQVSFDVTATWRDDDGDGMADTWEIAHGMDPTVDDANGDADGDGVSNIDEFTAGNGGETHPGVADVSSPADAAEVGAEDVTLEVVNALDPDAAGPATYHFELASDEDMANVLISASALEDSGGNAGFTAVVLDEAATDDAANGNDVDLDDNTWYFWRAQAEDDTGRFGPWNGTASFFYNPTNDPPTAPSLASPLTGNQVTSLSPSLTVGNSADPDDAVVTYTFAVFSDSAMANEVASSGAITAGSFGSTTWVVTPSLSDNTTYYWQVTANDATDTTNSVAGSFFVNLANNEPTAPALVGPIDGTTISTTSVTVEVTNSTDADGNTLVYLFELDTSPTFNTTDFQDSQNVPAGAGTTEVTFAGLSEDTTYWWRARAFDGFSTGDWVMGSFVVNAVNAAPSAPVALGPADGQVIDTVTPTLRVQNASDPEGAALTYSFDVRDESDVSVASGSAVAEGADVTTFTVPADVLEKGEVYTWTAVASDGTASSSASAVASFTVYKKASGGGGGGGCSVSGVQSAAPGSIAGLVAAFALVITARRRRRA